MTRRSLSRAAKVLAFAATLGSAATASAGGLYYADRGVRPLGRGGAFIAGADDAGAIAYNPAGLFDAGASFLFDASWVNFSSSYARTANLQQIDPNTGKVVGTTRETFPTVSGSTPFLPIPTIAGTFQPSKRWVVGLGVWAPYAALTSYPDSVNGKAAPQRYSLLSLDGSILAFAGAAVAFAPIKELRLGAEVGMLTGVFNSQVAFSGCVPERFLCSPEQSSWDVLTQLKAGPIFAPTGQIGAQFIPHPSWRIGLDFQLPVWVRTSGTLTSRLPATPVFEKASQSGSSGTLAFDLPWSIRAGVETRAVDDLRLEASFNFDKWSMHDAITLTPDHVAFKNVAGFPETYYVPTIAIPRHFQDSWAVHLGGEYTFNLFGLEWQGRLGTSYEKSAIPKEYLSVLTLDQDKVTAAGGLSVHIKKARIDLTYAHVFGLPVTVDPSEAKIAQISPVRANPPKNPDIINAGSYTAHADILGLGFAYTFDPAPTVD